MLEILLQETNTQHGNDCLIQNCYTVLKCHEQYVVVNIRRYRGWCDNGIEIRGKKDFDNYFDAVNYYQNELRGM